MHRFNSTTALTGALLLLLLVLLVIAYVLRPTRTSDPLACTHTRGPGDNAIAAWVTAAQPGQVLCLRPGTYTGSGNMISTTGRNGTAERRIVIRAEQEGTVLLDGEDSRRPLHLGGDYWQVIGIDVTRGDNHNIRFQGRHNLVQRVISLDVGKDGDGAINMGGQYNTIEDCAATGPARKQIPAGASTSGPGYNTVRRCFAQWTSNPHMSSNPTNALEVGYGQDDATYENVIATWAMQAGGRSTEPEGVIQLFATRRSKVLGSIFYVTSDASFQPARLVSAFNDGGSHAQQGNYHNTQDLLMQHVVAYIDPQHPRFADIQAYRFAESSEPSPAGTNNRIAGIVGVSGQPNSFSAQSWETPTQVQWGRTLAEAIGEGKSLWTDSAAAPAICQRVVSGQQTDTPLWPLPMNQRIVARAGIDVQATLEGLFGPIPAVCKSGSTPVPPDPTPVPPASVAMTCSGTVGSVPGQLVLECVPKEGKR